MAVTIAVSPAVATTQVRQLIEDAGLHSQVSRVFSHAEGHLKGRVATVVLVSSGDPGVVGRALAPLVGCEVVWGQYSVSVFWES